jgi:hypothetical protein
VQRIDQILGPIENRRFCDRVRCFLPVQVEEEGHSREEYALDLSASGTRLTTIDSLDPNTDLQFRFRLPMVSRDLVEASGRVVHQRSKRNSAGRYEVGIFFYPLEPGAQSVIECELARLLSD